MYIIDSRYKVLPEQEEFVWIAGISLDFKMRCFKKTAEL